jgi:hypothetical protein
VIEPTECRNPECDRVVTPEPGIDRYVRVVACGLTERRDGVFCSTECVGEVLG